MHDDVERILFAEAEILHGVDRLAAEIARDFAGEDLVCVSILKGSVIFIADLVRRLPLSLSLAFVHAESYRSGTTPGDLEIHVMPSEDELRGKSVLLVDDILDSGTTMTSVRAALLERGARRVATCVFLDKPDRRSVAIEVDYRCFEIPDLFVVGYGLDFAGRYRNLPYVAALHPAVIAEVRG